MHDHHHHQGHAHHHGAGADTPRRALQIALALTLGFTGVEIVVGLWSHSLALLADAGHMLGDSGALILSLVITHIAAKPRDAAKTYGYRRAEVLGALLNGGILLLVAGGIVLEALPRFNTPVEVHAPGMLVTAFIGLLVNLLSAWVLSSQSASNLNVRAAMLHVLSDALASIAVILAGIAVLVTDFRMADTVASLVISALILISTFRLVKETVHVLMEGVPPGVEVNHLIETITETPGVASTHDLHVWSLTPAEPMLTAHVVLEPGEHGVDICQRVGARIAQEHGIDHVTIQPEAPRPALVSLRRSSGRDAAKPSA